MNLEFKESVFILLFSFCPSHCPPPFSHIFSPFLPAAFKGPKTNWKRILSSRERACFWIWQRVCGRVQEPWLPISLCTEVRGMVVLAPSKADFWQGGQRGSWDTGVCKSGMEFLTCCYSLMQIGPCDYYVENCLRSWGMMWEIRGSAECSQWLARWWRCGVWHTHLTYLSWKLSIWSVCGGRYQTGNFSNMRIIYRKSFTGHPVPYVG